MGNDGIQNWIITFVISMCVCVFITLPFQVRNFNLFNYFNYWKKLKHEYLNCFNKKVLLMTAVFVFIFGKFNDSEDFESDNNASINVSQYTKEVKYFN